MPTPPRRRRLGLGLLLLAGAVLLLMAMPLWREHQLRQSCEQGHGRWESDAQRCILGPPPKSSSTPAPEPR